MADLRLTDHIMMIRPDVVGYKGDVCPFCPVAAEENPCDDSLGPYWCTQERGHEGDHVACAGRHLMRVWKR